MSHAENKAILYTSQDRSLYVGRTERILTRTNVSSTLLISLEDELELLDRSDKALHRSKSFLIPPGMKVSIDTRNSNLMMCFLNDMGTDLNNLIPKMNETICFAKNDCLYTGLSIEQEFINHQAFLRKASTTSQAALDQLLSWIEMKTPTLMQHSPDLRIEKAIDYIKLHYSENISVEQVARHVNLSVPRLVQLFKQVTGTPIRRFRQWHRIFTAAEKVAQGCTLTSAAVDSGFSDYAQFSRTFRQFAGGSPAAAKANTEVRLSKCA